MLRYAVVASGVVALGLLGCAGHQNLASEHMGKHPDSSQLTGKQSKCRVSESQERPLVVEWPAADRGSLEARIHDGTVVVAYSGCEMRVLRRCTVPDASYEYTGFTLKTETVRMTTADDLYANLPVGAAKLEAKLERSDALTVSMTLVGMYQSKPKFVHANKLKGACDGATHIVTGVQVGAYEFFVEQAAKVGAGVVVVNTGAGGESRAARDVLSRDGQAERCQSATSKDAAPPEGCGAILRLEVAPLDGVGKTPAPRVAASGTGSGGACPSGMAPIPAGTYNGDRIATFCLDTTEVTATAYSNCVTGGACTPVHSGIGCRNPGEHSRMPVNCVDWTQADAYCRAQSKRLPTEFEWTWAASGAGADTKYPWGHELPTSTITCWQTGGFCVVGTKRRGRSPQGVFDLAGNVSEWTASWFDGTSGERVLKGGSWGHPGPNDLSAAARYPAKPSAQAQWDGFRCAK